MKQENLLWDIPIVATDDPATSHLAADDINLSGRREHQVSQLLTLLRERPRTTSFLHSRFSNHTGRISDARKIMRANGGDVVCTFIAGGDNLYTLTEGI
jgi:hypothetical protein